MNFGVHMNPRGKNNFKNVHSVFKNFFQQKHPNIKTNNYIKYQGCSHFTNMKKYMMNMLGVCMGSKFAVEGECLVLSLSVSVNVSAYASPKSVNVTVLVNLNI